MALDKLDEFPESAIFVIPIRLDDCKPSHDKLRDLHGWICSLMGDGLKQVVEGIQFQKNTSAVSDKSKLGEKDISTPVKPRKM